MESPKIGLAPHQLLRHDSSASAVRQRRAANRIRGNGNAQLLGVSGSDAVPGFSSSTVSWDSPEEETNTRLLSMSLEPRGQVVRTPILFYFMSIVFLTGIFIGASLIPISPGLPPPPEIGISEPISQQIMTPTSDPATTDSDSSPEPATAQAGPAAVTPTELMLPQSTSAGARKEAGSGPLKPVQASTPQSEPPSGPESVTKPLMPSETVISTPSPIALAQAPATILNKAIQELERSERSEQFRAPSGVAAPSSGTTSITPRQAIFLKQFNGIWSNADCKKVSSSWTIVGDEIIFLHSDGNWSIEQIIQVSADRFLTQTVSSKIRAKGTRWGYRLVSGGIAIQNLSAGEPPMIEHRCDSLHGRR
jgi:hypothetical protein